MFFIRYSIIKEDQQFRIVPDFKGATLGEVEVDLIFDTTSYETHVKIDLLKQLDALREAERDSPELDLDGLEEFIRG